MANSRIEASIHALNGERLERLMEDLLQREDYDVDPTGISGPDGGREALLYAEDRTGILHCSVQKDWEKKAHDDAEKAANLEQEFDLFIFATNAEMAGITRDRVEEEITDEWDMKTTIWDYERIREALVGDPENHHLIREHLSVDPTRPFVSIENKVDELYTELLERVKRRESPDNTPIIDGAIVSVHVIPQEAIDEHHDRYVDDLPHPPQFSREDCYPDNHPKVKICDQSRNKPDGKSSRYTAIHRDGWTEGVLIYNIGNIGWRIDKRIVNFVDSALEKFEEADIYPPYFVYVSVLDAEEYTISMPVGYRGSTGSQQPFSDDEIRLNRVRIDDKEANVAEAMRKSLDQLWMYCGWTESFNYERKETEDGKTIFEFKHS